MKTIFTPNQQINAGNFIISIGKDGVKDVAIFSKTTGDFVKLTTKKRSKKLRAVHRKFNKFISSFDSFCFSWFTDDKVVDLINILRK